MTPEQINAAKLLGHTTETWNHGMTQDDAATKIAANFRGKKTRREFVAKVRRTNKPNVFLCAMLVALGAAPCARLTTLSLSDRAEGGGGR